MFIKLHTAFFFIYYSLKNRRQDAVTSMLLLCAQLHIYTELCLPLSALLDSEWVHAREKQRSDEVTDGLYHSLPWHQLWRLNNFWTSLIARIDLVLYQVWQYQRSGARLLNVNFFIVHAIRFIFFRRLLFFLINCLFTKFIMLIN